MARVLVTGANGFVGSRLATELANQGHEVTALVRRTSDLQRLESLGVTLAYGDVTDADSLAAPIAGQEAVYHLAGTLKAFRYRDFLSVNERGARHVAEACARQSPPPVLVLVSSLAAAGPARDGRPLIETDPPAPISKYGRSKRAGELAVAALADRVPTTIVRPSIVFGPSDYVTLEMFRPIARFGVHTVPALRDHRFSAIHVDDLADLVIRAARQGERLEPAQGEEAAVGRGVYFAAGEQQPTYAELGRMMGAALGRRVCVLRNPKPVVWLVATAGELVARVRRRPALFNFDKAREATAGSWICSPEKARDQLGFQSAASLQERLDQTVRWYREHGYL